ncbi:MAG: hypothetical protein IKC48_00890 [Clostridia bacterium]|nr:hypothetical protein [Clostridia bacterium]
MKKIKKAIWIPSLVVVVLAAVILTLSLIKVNPMINTFGEYSRIELIATSSGAASPDIKVDGESVTTNTLNSSLESTKFSVMQAILEGKFSYKVELTDETVTSSALRYYSALNNEYVLKLYYDEVQTMTVDDVEIKYDRVFVRLYETNGEIHEVECVPYLEYNIDNGSFSDEYDEDGKIGSAFYEAHVLTVKMNTSKAMASIAEYLALYN